MRRLVLLLTALVIAALLPAAASAAPTVDGTFDLSDQPGRLKQGPDGNVWFTVGGTKELGRITPDGTVTEYDAPNDRELRGIVAGEPGHVWFSYNGGVLDWDIAAGTGTEHAIPEIGQADGMARDGAGNFWVVDTLGALVVVKPNGDFDREVLFGGMSSGRDIVRGGDGRMWWVDFGTKAVRATPADAVDDTTTQTLDVDGGPQDLAVGADGVVAFSNPGADPQHVGRFTPAGGDLGDSVTGPGTDPFGAAFGTDGAWWFAGFAAGTAIRLAPDGTVTSLPVGPPNSARRLSPGANNTLWVGLELQSKIVRISGVDPAAPPAAGGGSTTPPVTTPAPVTPAVDRIAPSLRRFSLLRTRFRVGARATAIAAAQRRRRPRTTPIGTTFRFALGESAAVALRIEKRTSGRRRGRSCVKPTRSNRRARRCTRFVLAGTLRRTGRAGANAVPFTGRIGRKALKPGRHRVAITAVDAAGNRSRPRTAGFTVLR